MVKKKINIKNSPTWGPVLADKPRTRTHGNIKNMVKAGAYMMMKNLEIPATFKGKSFATLDPNELASHTSKVDLCIGNNEEEQKNIILDLINNEKLICLQFADENPEIVLPDNLDLVEVNDFNPVFGQKDTPDTEPVGTAGSVVECPTLNTKKKPCGLSHPFKFK